MLIRARAPLRLGLAGGGTDVAPFCDLFGGAVLNATVDLYAHCTIEPSPDGKIRFTAADVGDSVTYDLAPVVPIDGPLALHSGVYNRIVAQYNGGKPMAVAVTTFCDAPPGSGLGSSSTLVVAMVQAFGEILNLPLGEYDIASLAYQIERCDLGLQGGRQDQYAASFGGFNFMEFNGHDHVLVNPLRVKDWIISELESSLVLFYTGKSRDSAAIIAEQSLNVENHNQKAIDAMHRTKKDAISMKECLLRGDIRQLGVVMESAWQTKKEMAGSISNERLERFYKVARDAGAYCGKVSGAGGGGFMMFLVDMKYKLRVVEALTATREGSVVSCHFTSNGVESWRLS
jgi:D-glycero-alpha-D-manno-heptose-7-phosphate kinase